MMNTTLRTKYPVSVRPQTLTHWLPAMRRQVLWVAVAMALGIPAAEAQVHPDGTTPTSTQAAASGVPVVNIAAPNSAGLSHNTYQQFDVGKEGLILNNSGALSKTQLAGYITGNPHLSAGQSARLILNEVTSTLPSQLNGAMEVAGTAAEVIVANPNGISCTGCGFINTPHGVLTTGIPILGNDGSLSAYRVTGGAITVDGAGLNATPVDQVDLIARAVQINAGVWANRQLNVVTGASQVDAATLATQTIAGTGPAPVVALDVSALGGMYAGVIRLVGTEAGVGVNSQGQIAAQNGSLTLTSAGQLVLSGQTTATGTVTVGALQAVKNTGTLAAGGGVSVSSGSDLSSSGTLYSGAGMTLTAAGQLNNSGQMQAQGGALTLQANGALSNVGSGSIYANGPIKLNAAALVNSGQVEAARGISGSFSGQLTNGGSLQADAGNLILSGSSIASTGALSAGGNASLTGSSSVSSSGSLVANGAITLNAPTLTTVGTVQAGTILNIAGGSLGNSGKLYALGGNETFQLSGAMTSAAGSDIYSTGNITLNAASLNNAGGIEAKQAVNVIVGGALSNSGTVQADLGSIAFGAGSLSNSGIFSAQQQLQGQVAQGLSNSGTLISGYNLSLSAGRFSNAVGGQLQSGTDLTLDAATISNAGSVDAKGGATLRGGDLSNTAGAQWIASGALTIDNTGTVSNAGVLQAGDALTLTHASALDNTAGATLYAGGALNLALSQQLSNAGTLYGANVANVAAGSVVNSGVLRSGGALSLNSAGDVTSSGAIEAQQALQLTSGGAFANSGKLYAVNGSLMAQAAGAWSSSNSGDIYSGQAITINGGSIVNAGMLEAMQSVSLMAQGMASNSGTVQADRGDLSFNGAMLGNQGALSASGNVTLAGAQSLTNSGTVVGGQALTLTSANLSNSGQTQSGSSTTLQATAFNNSGRLQSGTSLAVSGNQTLSNASSGLLLATGAVNIDTSSLLSNAGVIQAGGSLAVSGAGSVDNQASGTLSAGQQTRLQLGGALDNAGVVYGAQGLSLIANGLSNLGTLRSGAGLGLTVHGNASNRGTAYALNDARWGIDGWLNNSGILSAGGNTTITAASLTGTGTLAAGLLADGSLGVSGMLSVTTTGTLASNGRALAGGSMVLQGSSVDLSHSQTRAGSTITLDAVQGDVSNQGGNLAANGTVTIHAAGGLLNGGTSAAQGGVISGSTLALQVASLDNRYGRMSQTGSSDLSLSLAGAFDNAGGTFATNAGNLSISASSIDNTTGTIQHAGTGTLTLASNGNLTNAGGQIAGNGALVMRAGGSLSNAGGNIGIANDATLQASALDNSGAILAAHGVDINISQAVTNVGGTLQAGGALTLNTGSLDNSGGYLKATGTQTVAITASGALTNAASAGTGGFIGGNGIVTVQAGSLVNAGQIYAGSTLGVDSQGSLSNDGGALQAMGSLSVRSNGTMSNRAGQMEAGAGSSAAMLVVSAASLDNTSGRIADSGVGATTVNVAQNLVNQGGTLGGQGGVSLGASSLDNSNNGDLVAGQDLSLSLGGMNNRAGTVYAAGNLGWSNSAASLANAFGNLGAGSNLALTLGSLDNTGGALAANGNVSLNLASFSGSGRTAAGQDLLLILGSGYSNTTTNQLVANRDMTLNLAGDFSNAAGATLQAVRKLTVNANNIDNAAGAAINSGTTTLNASSGTLSNEGRLEGDAIALSTSTLDNTGAIIGGTITATATALTNGADLGSSTTNNAYQSALIAATNGIDLYVGGTLLNRDASIFTLGNLTIGANANGGLSQAVTNLSGDIEAEGNVTINTNQFTNQRRMFQTGLYTLMLAEQAQNTTTQTVPIFRSDEPHPGNPPPNVPASQMLSPAQIAALEAYCSSGAMSNPGKDGGRWCGGDVAPGQNDPHDLWHNDLQAIVTDTLVSVERLAAASAPSQLLAGGNITLNGSVLNDKSTIAAGNNLIINGSNGAGGGGTAGNYTVRNVAWTPTGTVQETTAGQTSIEYISFNPSRHWAILDYETWGTYQNTLSIGLGADQPSWITYNAGDGLAATMSAGQAVNITAQTINNTVVGADGQPVHAVIGLGQNSGAQGVSGSSVGAVGSVSGGVGSIGGIALGGAPSLAGGGSLTQAQTRNGVAMGSGPGANGASQGASTPAAPQAVASLIGPNPTISLPQSGLYTIHSQPGSPYLVVTDPRFANYSNFISSDYMLQQLSYNPAATAKRLGDGFYEEQQVLSQITDLTGRRFLSDNTDALNQYRDLMNSGVQAAQQFGLSVGVALTAAQMAGLTQDIVWLVSAQVDGQSVLVPVVYLSAANAKNLAANGATIAGKNVILTATGDITNNGSISASQRAQLTAANLLNSGNISAGNNLSINAAQNILNGGTLGAGGNVSLVAGNDVLSGVNVAQQLGAVSLGGMSAPVSTVAMTLIGPGSITAGGSLGISAGRDISLDTAPVAAGSNLSLAAGRDLTATATAIAADGGAQLLAGRDISLDASGHTTRIGGSDATQNTRFTVSTVTAGDALVVAAGRDLTSQGAQLSAGNQLGVSAGRDLTLNTVTDTTTQSTQYFQGRTNVTTQTADQTVRGSTLSGVGAGVVATAGHDLIATAATITSANGAVALGAGHDLTLNAADETHNTTVDTRSHSGGLLSSSSTHTQTSTQTSNAIGTTISGDTVTLAAGHDLTVQAAQIAGTHDVALAAGNNLTLTTADSIYSQISSTSTTKSGLMNGGGLSVMLGEAKQSQRSTQTETTPIGSVVGSLNGSATLTAGNTVHLTNATVLSDTDTTIVGKNVIIDAAVGTIDTTQSYKQSSVGLHVGLTGGVVSAAQATYGYAKQASRAGDDRLKALEGAQAAYATKDVITGTQAVLQGGAQGATDASGVSLRIGIGASSTSSKATTHDDIAYGSSIHSNGNVTIAATGGDLNVIGSQIDGNDVALAAANNINLFSQAEQHTKQESNKNASSEIGFSVGAQTGWYVTASAGKGKANGNGTTHADSVVNASDTLTMVSGNDTTIQGAQAKGNTVLASVGGNLNITSEQDTDDYASKQQQAGGTFVYGYGGNASYGKNAANSHYQSVTQTSGIGAGNGGYQIDVNGNTDLTGAVIASTADASKNLLDTGTLTFSDIENQASAKVSATNLSGDSSMASGSKYGAAKGVAGNLLGSSSDSNQRASTTQAGVAQGTIITRDGDASLEGLNRNPSLVDQALKPVDTQTLQDNVAFSQAAKAVGYQVGVYYTEEVYKTSFIKKVDVQEAIKDDKGNFMPGRKLTEEEKMNLQSGADGKVHIADNGIFNDAADAEKYAKQHSTTDGPQYYAVFPRADNAFSELLVAAYQKILENDFWGLTNATVETKLEMIQYGQSGLDLDGHSRGAMTIVNAMESLANQGNQGILSGTTEHFFGPAGNAAKADALLSYLQNRGSVTDPAQQQSMVLDLQNHIADPVGRFIGRNPATGGTIPEGSSAMKEMLRAIGGLKNTSHNCYGAPNNVACKALWNDTPGNRAITLPINSLDGKFK